MDYYRLLSLAREPFSNSPDPAFFYRSPQHASCLDQLEIALRLGRGLNLVVGPVGTGKTTLCRQLYRQLCTDERIDCHLVLDPGEIAEHEFLSALASRLLGREPQPNEDDAALKDALRRWLFRRAVEQKRTVVLLIDESQKLTPARLEVLRELLNYETNERKLLQIALFAQPEIEALLARCENLADRINVLLKLQPLTRSETADMIRFRLETARDPESSKRISFSGPALRAVHRATSGSPRQIVHLCHRLMLALILQERTTVTSDMVSRASGRALTARAPRVARALAWCAAALMLAMLPQSLTTSPKPPAPLTPATVEAPAPETPETGMMGAEAAPLPAEPLQLPKVTTLADTPPAPMPERLGTLRVSSRETLWTMTGRVYGDCNSKLLKVVTTENTQFPSPEKIFVGAEVHFPALNPIVPPAKPYVLLGEYETLEEAYALVLKWHTKNHVLGLLAVHTPQKGLHFQVVSGGFQDNAFAAKKVLDSLPGPLNAMAAISDPLPPDAVLLAGLPEHLELKPKPESRMVAERRSDS